MSMITNALKVGLLSLALAGCSGGGSGDSSANTSNTEPTTVEKSFTVSLANVEVARTADGMPVTLETSEIQSAGKATISQ